jgi:hypothetical protein
VRSVLPQRWIKYTRPYHTAPKRLLRRVCRRGSAKHPRLRMADRRGRREVQTSRLVSTASAREALAMSLGFDE